ncbi:MAG: T9SS type A sorting domain-containing protein, partial [bacterium]
YEYGNSFIAYMTYGTDTANNIRNNVFVKTNRSDLRIWPNPSINKISYSINSCIDGNISLKIYNCRGNIVSNINNSYMKYGDHANVWRHNLQPGNYFIALKSRDLFVCEKLIIVR